MKAQRITAAETQAIIIALGLKIKTGNLFRNGFVVSFKASEKAKCEATAELIKKHLNEIGRSEYSIQARIGKAKSLGERDYSLNVDIF